MNEIKITIDGQECIAQEGEFILNIARRNGIYIPAICYLTGCSPTLACRICLVEADGKRVYSCNAKAKDGMQVITTNEEILGERRAIMEVYDVNHPLECGVCDQSGECELQNYTLHEKVDSQNFAIRDTNRPTADWGLIHYDSSLCIVCERCSTVCKDSIGDSALKTVARGGDALSKELKDTMPKDAYAMWNKLQKSVIGTTTGEALDCTFCGECISVCPVGALVSSEFQYKSNAWELTSIPATCAHCSAGCELFYDIKHTSIDNTEKRIYRVKNDFHFQALCGAGRFGFDFENRVKEKNDTAFADAISAFKSSDTIHFSSYITNEEALILQKLKEKFGYYLVNKDANSFKKFLSNYSSVTGSLYEGSLDSIKASDFVVSIGTNVKSDNPLARFALNSALKMNKGAGFYFHPVGDPIMDSLSKNFISINHAPGKEEAALYLILDLFGKELPQTLSEYLATFKEEKTKIVKEVVKENVTEIVKDEESGEEKEVKKVVSKTVEKEIKYTYNKLLEMVGYSDIENFADAFAKMLAKKVTFSLIAGEDLYMHPRAKNIATLLGLIAKYSDFSVTIIPPKTNSLGVALICDLDDTSGDKVIGYNASGDFRLSALGDGDLDMPSLNQQEGTFTNINKRVVPTNAALSYNGYTLNDIANALLGISVENTIDYTPYLPQQKGYKAINFDDMDHRFTNAGEEQRGYLLDIQTDNTEDVIPQEIDDISSFDGLVVYKCNPVLQFSDFTNSCSQLQGRSALMLSLELAQELGVEDGSAITLKNDFGEVSAEVNIDDKIAGKIICVPDFEAHFAGSSLFDGYRFANATLINKQ
jgi:NADH-quinone oxidoreductase subunit G